MLRKGAGAAPVAFGASSTEKRGSTRTARIQRQTRSRRPPPLLRTIPPRAKTPHVWRFADPRIHHALTTPDWETWHRAPQRARRPPTNQTPSQ